MLQFPAPITQYAFNMKPTVNSVVAPAEHYRYIHDCLKDRVLSKLCKNT